MIFGRLALLQSFASYLLTYCSLNMSDQPHVIVEIVLLSFDALLSRRPLIKAQGVTDVIDVIQIQQSYRCLLGSILSELAVSSGLMPSIHGACGDGPRWTAFLPRIPVGRLWVPVKHSRTWYGCGDLQVFLNTWPCKIVDFLSIRNYGCSQLQSRFKASLNHHVSRRTPLTN